jgi:hypothetical protein
VKLVPWLVKSDRIGMQQRYQDQQAECLEFAREKVTFTRIKFALLVSIESTYRHGKKSNVAVGEVV